MREEEDEGSETCIHNSEALEYGFEIPTLIQILSYFTGFIKHIFFGHHGPFSSLWLSVCKYDL